MGAGTGYMNRKDTKVAEDGAEWAGGWGTVDGRFTQKSSQRRGDAALLVSTTDSGTFHATTIPHPNNGLSA